MAASLPPLADWIKVLASRARQPPSWAAGAARVLGAAAFFVPDLFDHGHLQAVQRLHDEHNRITAVQQEQEKYLLKYRARINELEAGQNERKQLELQVRARTCCGGLRWPACGGLHAVPCCCALHTVPVPHCR